MNDRVFHERELRRFTREVLIECGVQPDRARDASAPLVFAEARGFTTHGLGSLEALYVARMCDGRVDPAATPVAVSSSGAVACYDARNGLGLAVAVQAMRKAMAKAHAYGVGIVVVRGSTHFGAAGYYSWMASQQGMIGIAASNLGTQAVAPPPGGAVKVLGTNPISAVAPGGELPPFAMDMSTTVVSTGKVRAAARSGVPVPPGWLADEAGDPVTDPAKYDSGEAQLLWLGSHPETGAFKGLGLALLVEILTAGLSGAGSGTAGLDEDRDVGHFFMALDVGRFRPLEAFTTSVDGMLAAIAQQATYPGYLESRRGRDDGTVELSDAGRSAVARLARRFGVRLPRPAPRARTEIARS